MKLRQGADLRWGHDEEQDAADEFEDAVQSFEDQDDEEGPIKHRGARLNFRHGPLGDRIRLSSAEAIAKADRAQDILAWLARWIRDLVLIQVGGDRDQILYLDDLTTLESYAQQADTDSLLRLLREIEMTEQRATRHLNLHMALEMILLRLRDAVAASSVPVPA